MSESRALRRASSQCPHWTDRVREVYKQSLNDHLEDVLENERDEFVAAFATASQDCESPIEALFLAAFIPYAIRDTYYHIQPQEQIGKYRADFVITFTPDERFIRKIVIECDGHDYHDRTKEQAERDKSRDRAISAAGMPVFRFTGRELQRDPHACVEEIIDYTQGQLLDEAYEQLRGR